MAYETNDNSSNGAMLPTVEKSENSGHVRVRHLQQLSMNKSLRKICRHNTDNAHIDKHKRTIPVILARH